MIRHIVLVLILLLAGCCACPETPDYTTAPAHERRRGDVATITSSLNPLINLSSAAFISSVLWVETSKIPLEPDVKTPLDVQAGYEHLDIIYYRPGTDAQTLAHEVLHVFWEHQLVPDRAEFLNSVRTVLDGSSKHEGFVRNIIAGFDEMVRTNYPDILYDTEMYAYIGQIIMLNEDFCVPEIILRHYRGVLNQSLLDRRVCAQSD